VKDEKLRRKETTVAKPSKGEKSEKKEKSELKKAITVAPPTI
jgi:hypothetical protein